MVARAATQQASFAAGMLDRDLAARQDVNAYYAGALEIRNMHGLPLGGQTMRQGFCFIAEIADAAADGALGLLLREFEFSSEQKYLLVFTHLSIRVFRNGVLQAQLTTPYPGRDLAGLRMTQSLDTLILTHPDYRYRKLVRQGAHDRWALEQFDITNLPSHEFGLCFPAGLVIPAATSGLSIDLTCDRNWFVAGDLGATIKGNGGTATIASVVSPKLAKINISTPFQDATPIAGWSFDMSTAASKSEDTWSDRRGWPSSVYFFEGRLYFGGSQSRPQTEWGSVTNDFFNFEEKTASDGEPLDDSAVEFSMDGDRVSKIQQQYALDDFFLFTSGGVFVAKESPVTPKNFYFQRHTEVPAADIRPQEMDGSVVFISDSFLDEDGIHHHQTVQELLPAGTDETGFTIYQAQDLALLSGSLMREPVDMAARRGGFGNSAHHLFVVNSDGTMAVLNTRKSQSVTGWTLWDTEGEVLRVSVVGRSTYIVVKRNINGTDRYFLERLKLGHDLDCSLSSSEEHATRVWGGFDHLEGHTVRVLGPGGADLGAQPVSNGMVTTPYDVTSVEVGLPFDWAVETMPIEAKLSDGTLIGNAHRIVRASIRFSDTRGPVSVNGQTIVFTEFGEEALDAPPPSFTGLRTLRFLGWCGGQYRRDGGATIRVAGDSAARATVLSVTSEIAA